MIPKHPQDIQVKHIDLSIRREDKGFLKGSTGASFEQNVLTIEAAGKTVNQALESALNYLYYDFDANTYHRLFDNDIFAHSIVRDLETSGIDPQTDAIIEITIEVTFEDRAKVVLQRKSLLRTLGTHLPS